MTLIETTYRELHEAGLVHTREQFSTNYVGKNSNWYSYQTHMGRDFSVLAAAHCLRTITKLAHVATVQPQQQRSLSRVSALLSSYLREQHLAVVQS
jgi:hypothetical protein